jgi:hypothetical protein
MWRPVCPPPVQRLDSGRHTISSGDEVDFRARWARGSLSDPRGQPAATRQRGPSRARHGLNARSDANGVHHGDRRDQARTREDLAEAVGQRRSPSSERRSRSCGSGAKALVRGSHLRDPSLRRSSRARGARVSVVGRRSRRTRSCSGRSARSASRPCEPWRCARAGPRAAPGDRASPGKPGARSCSTR